MDSGRDTSTLELRLLGPVEVQRAGVTLELGGPQQRAVLAHLALARSRVVPTERLITRLWGEDAPASAVGTLQSYVSRLRTILEPGRRAGAAATVLVSEPPGYALRLAPGAVDLLRFEDLAAAGRTAMHGGDDAAALARFDAALAEWRGQPLGGVGNEAAVDAIVTRLEEDRDGVVEDRFDVLLRLGRHASAIGALQEAVSERPLRERLWGQLALALYRSHRQAGALRALSTARTTLAEELGLVPGPELQALEAQILAHAPQLAPAGRGVAVLVGGDDAAAGSGGDDAATGSGGDSDVDIDPTPGDGGRRGASSTGRGPAPFVAATPALVRLVGRSREWGHLATALDRQSGVVTIEGEPGIGKTTLLDALTEEATRRGWAVVWGRCVEQGLAPALWPWIEVLRAIAATTPGAAFEFGPSLAELAMPSGGAPAIANLVEVADDLAAELIAGDELRLVVLDDLHWADQPTLELLSLLVRRVAIAPVLVAIAHRPVDLGSLSALTTTLAGIARLHGVTRIGLSGLDAGGVSELMTDIAGSAPPTEVIERVHRRSGGNPLFVTELARLAGSDGVGHDDVPGAVRDVVRGRLAPLPAQTVQLLTLAALLGHEVELRVLIAAAELPIDACLDGLEPAVAGRLLVPGEDGRFRFGHALVRDVLLADVSALRSARLHLRVADALEEVFGADRDHAELIAVHRWAALSIDDPLRIADALLIAADTARLHVALSRADELVDMALVATASAATGAPRLEREIVAVETMLRVETARSFMVDSLDRIAARIEEVARRYASDAARILGLFARWAKINTGTLPSVEAYARDALALAERSSSAYVYVLGTHVWASHCWHSGRVSEAVAHYADALAAAERSLRDDPGSRVPPGMPAGFAALAFQAAGLDERADDALDLFGRMLRDRPGDRFAGVDAIFFPASVAAMRGDAAAVERITAPVVEDSIGVEQPHFSPACRVLHGWAVAVQTGSADAARLATAAMAAVDAGPARVGAPMFRTYQAEALLRAGDAARALDALALVGEQAEATGERWYLPEALRLRGEATLAACGDPAVARALFEQAAALADEQGEPVFAARARSWLTRVPAG